MEYQKNINLSQYTTFKIGGNAKLFAEPTNLEEMLDALSDTISLAAECEVPLQISHFKTLDRFTEIAGRLAQRIAVRSFASLPILD